MSNVLLIVQLIISIVLTGLILIQRSEGGALGIGGGGGGGGGGFMSGRSAATSISRATAILGAVFIVNCLVLSIVFNIETRDQSIIDEEGAVEALTIDTDSGETTTPSIDVSPEASGTDETADPTVEDLIKDLPDISETDLTVEPSETPEETPETP